MKGCLRWLAIGLSVGCITLVAGCTPTEQTNEPAQVTSAGATQPEPQAAAPEIPESAEVSEPVVAPETATRDVDAPDVEAEPVIEAPAPQVLAEAEKAKVAVAEKTKKETIKNDKFKQVVEAAAPIVAEPVQSEPKVEPVAEKAPAAPVAQPFTPIEGGWENQAQKISGGWRIVERADGLYVELDDAFKTRRAPDLKLFLSPRGAKQVTARNATENSVFIAQLDQARGAQAYRLPQGVDLDTYRSLVLHCEQYTKLWGAGQLAKP